MIRQQARVAVLVSGGGTNLQAILDAQDSGVISSGRVCLVIANNPAAFALQRAEKARVPARVITKRDCGSQEAFENLLMKTLDEAKIDLIVLAGFMSILSERFTGRYEKRILNVHPSLIPAFCGQGFYGLRVHEAALARGVRITGATVHYVNEIPDGGEIILQKAVRVYPGDTPERLQKRVMRQAEWKLLPAAVEMVSAGIVQKKEEEA